MREPLLLEVGTSTNGKLDRVVSTKIELKIVINNLKRGNGISGFHVWVRMSSRVTPLEKENMIVNEYFDYIG
jgi:DNA-binding cell septation regulator SpoVG